MSGLRFRISAVFIVTLVLGATLASGLRHQIDAELYEDADTDSDLDLEEDAPQTKPIGLVVTEDEFQEFVHMIGVLGEGGQSTVLEGLVGDAADLATLAVEKLERLLDSATQLSAATPEKFRTMKNQRPFIGVLNFIESHHDRFGKWGFEVEIADVRKAKTYIEEDVLRDARERLQASRANGSSVFDNAMTALESKSNPYAPNFRTLKGRHVALKVSTASDEDRDMLFKEVIFGKVLQSAEEQDDPNWKVGGYHGFFCVQSERPDHDVKEKKYNKRCFSRFCPYGTNAFIVSDVFPGHSLHEKASGLFDNSGEAEHFMEKVSAAVSFMHARGVEHGDMAARNVLFDKPKVAIIDLGYCSFRDEESALSVLNAFRSHDPPLFQDVINSEQCPMDYLGKPASFTWGTDATWLQQWLPTAVKDYVDKAVVNSKLKLLE